MKTKKLLGNTTCSLQEPQMKIPSDVEASGNETKGFVANEDQEVSRTGGSGSASVVSGETLRDKRGKTLC